MERIDSPAIFSFSPAHYLETLILLVHHGLANPVGEMRMQSRRGAAVEQLCRVCSAYFVAVGMAMLGGLTALV